MDDQYDMSGNYPGAHIHLKGHHEEHQHHHYASVRRVEIDEDAARALG